MFILECGPKTVAVHDPVVWDGESYIGCMICGNGDIYDLGFTDAELSKYGLTVRFEHYVLVRFKGEKDATSRRQEQTRQETDQPPRRPLDADSC